MFHPKSWIAIVTALVPTLCAGLAFADPIPNVAGFAHRDQPFRVIMTGRSGSS
jgi:hypothetical protein